MHAEREVEPPDAASHVVTGSVQRVFTRSGENDREYVVQIRVDGVEKGEGYQKGDYIYAYAFKRKPDAPLEPAASGHDSVPVEGQRVRARIKRGNGLMEALYPFWYDVLEPDGTRAHSAPAGTIRGDLEKWLQRFNDNTRWRYGERCPGELAGVWMPVDGSAAPLVFGADGSFSEAFNGRMVSGLYAISETGRIATFCRSSNGGALGSHFQFDGCTIKGPKGPDPEAAWTRVGTTK